MTKVVLCADDYGMSAGISRGIVELAAAGRISAASAMTVSPRWKEDAEALLPHAGRIGIGLHLTLTGPFPPLGPMARLAAGRRFPPLGKLVQAALGRRLPLREIAAEIERQLDAFAAAFGRPPGFLDGHQHVHALPGIRTALLEVLRDRGLAGALWLRDPADRPSAILRRASPVKALVVAGLAAGFGAAARRAGFATNRGFSGFSAFDPAGDVAADMARFLDAPGPAHLVMCHPGHVEPGEELDGVVEARAREFAYLASDAFPALLAERRLTLAPAPG